MAECAFCHNLYTTTSGATRHMYLCPAKPERSSITINYYTAPANHDVCTIEGVPMNDKANVILEKIKSALATTRISNVAGCMHILLKVYNSTTDRYIRLILENLNNVTALVDYDASMPDAVGRREVQIFDKFMQQFAVEIRQLFSAKLKNLPERLFIIQPLSLKRH